MQERKLQVRYKSGNTSILTTTMTAEELGKKIRNNDIDINPNNLTMIRWSEVEALVELSEDW